MKNKIATATAVALLAGPTLFTGPAEASHQCGQGLP